MLTGMNGHKIDMDIKRKTDGHIIKRGIKGNLKHKPIGRKRYHADGRAKRKDREHIKQELDDVNAEVNLDSGMFMGHLCLRLIQSLYMYSICIYKQNISFVRLLSHPIEQVHRHRAYIYTYIHYGRRLCCRQCFSNHLARQCW